MTTTDLLTRRTQLHAEMLNSKQTDQQWWRDRVEEMAWLNRTLARMGIIPPFATN